MTRRANDLLALTSAVLVATGIVIAGGTVYQLSYPLTGPGASPVNGTNTLALPYTPAIGINTAADLAADIDFAGPGSVVQILRYNKATNGLTSYATNGADPTGFAIVPGECYRVQVDDDVDYVVAGSTDPSFVVTLTGPGLAPVNGTNTYSIPLFAVSTTAADLAAEVDSNSFPGNVVQVQRYVKVTNGLESYATSGTDLIGFDLVLGACYRIQVNAGVSFVPSHF